MKMIAGKIRKGLINASYLTISNIILQIIHLIAFIYITRSLGAEKYGIWATVTTYVSFFLFLNLSGMDKVLIRKISRDLDNTRLYLEQSITFRNLLIIFSITICIIGLFFTNYDSETKSLVVIYSLFILFRSTNTFLLTIYRAHEKFKSLALINIINKFIYIIPLIIIVFFSFPLIIFVITATLATGITTVIIYISSRNIVRFTYFSKLFINKRDFKQSFIFSLIAISEFLASKGDILVLSFLSSNYEVGIYAVAFMLISNLAIIRNVIADVFFPITVKSLDQKLINFNLLFRYSLHIVLLLSTIVFVFQFFVDDIFLFLFGKSYAYSSVIFKYLLIYLVIEWSSLPFTNYLQASHNEMVLLYVSPLKAISNILLILFFYQIFGLIGVVYSKIIVHFIGNLLLVGITYYKIKD